MKQVQPGNMKDATMTSKIHSAEGAITEYVTTMIGGQLFGLPISRVQDVFMPERLTRVPLSSGDVAGVLNLRGRIVTAIDMRARLGLPKNADGKPPMAVGVDLRGLEARGRKPRGQSGQSRPADGENGRRRSPARRSAHGRARRRPHSRN